MPARALIALALLVGVAGAAGTPAATARTQADVRVTGSVSESSVSRLQVSGTGFQSIAHGHGGVYVLFGTVRPGWQPSQGGSAGRDYYVVPDSQTRVNRGYEKFVAFPGSDTASSANGGLMSAAGAWSTSLAVPGPTFRAFDRSGAVHTVDCRRVTCGVITIGAHGVVNDRNETFTPVRVTGPESDPAGSATATPKVHRSTLARPSPERTPAGPARLRVDRRTAVAGRVLAFSASGLPARTQVSAVLDDGVAATGPFVAGDDGRLSGVLTLPRDFGPGTHQLRLYGVARAPSVRFAVGSTDDVTAQPVATTTSSDSSERAGALFAAGAGLILILAVARLVLGRRREGDDAG